MSYFFLSLLFLLFKKNIFWATLFFILLHIFGVILVIWDQALEHQLVVSIFGAILILWD